METIVYFGEVPTEDWSVKGVINYRSGDAVKCGDVLLLPESVQEIRYDGGFTSGLPAGTASGVLV